MAENQKEALKEPQKEIIKEAKKKEKPPVKKKFYYDIKVEAMLPATLTYRVLAEDPQQAIDMIKNTNPSHVQYKLPGRKEIVLRVYDAGCSVIKLMLKVWNGKK